jgi:hypothetical protein
MHLGDEVPKPQLGSGAMLITGHICRSLWARLAVLIEYVKGYPVTSLRAHPVTPRL